MDAARLRLLRELGDRGSVTAVASALHVSASAVSQQLAALQSGIPVTLTVKQGRKLVLTEAGAALAAAGTRVEEALSAARDTIDGFFEHEGRAVSVSAFHSAALTFFGPLLALTPEGPRVSLVDADVSLEAFPGLTADHDLVIAHRLAHDPDWPRERIVVTPLLVEPLDIALSADHPLAGREEIRPEDLRGQRWISTHEGFPLAGIITLLGALSGEPPHIAHRINEFSVTAQVVRTGDAIAIMPRTTSTPLAVDGMVLRPVAGANLARHVDVLARPDALARTPVRRALTAMTSVARSLAENRPARAAPLS